MYKGCTSSVQGLQVPKTTDRQTTTGEQTGAEASGERGGRLGERSPVILSPGAWCHVIRLTSYASSLGRPQAYGVGKSGPASCNPRAQEGKTGHLKRRTGRVV